MIFLFIGCVFIVIGGLFFIRPAKEMNFIYGYRSERAKETAASWDFAQKLSGNYFLMGGFLMAAIGLLLKYFDYTNFYLIELLLIPWVIAPMFGLIEQKLEAFNDTNRGEENETFND